MQGVPNSILLCEEENRNIGSLQKRAGKNTGRDVRGGFGCRTYVASRLHVFKCLYLRTSPPGPRPTPPYTAQPPSAAMLSLVDQRFGEGASVATAAFLDSHGRVRASTAPPPGRRKLRRSSANRHHATMSCGCRDGLHTVDTSFSVRHKHYLAENTTMTEKKRVKTLLTQLIAIRQFK